MAKQANHVTGHCIHAGLVILTMEFQERLFPGTPTLGQKRVDRGRVFLMEDPDRVEQVDRLDKGPAFDLGSTLILERDGTDTVILAFNWGPPPYNVIGVGETRIMLVLGKNRKRLETGVVSLKMADGGPRGPILVRHRSHDTGTF